MPYFCLSPQLTERENAMRQDEITKAFKTTEVGQLIRWSSLQFPFERLIWKVSSGNIYIYICRLYSSNELVRLWMSNLTPKATSKFPRSWFARRHAFRCIVAVLRAFLSHQKRRAATLERGEARSPLWCNKTKGLQLRLGESFDSFESFRQSLGFGGLVY